MSLGRRDEVFKLAVDGEDGVFADVRVPVLQAGAQVGAGVRGVRHLWQLFGGSGGLCRGGIHWGVARCSKVRGRSRGSEVWMGTDEVVSDGIPVGGVSGMMKGAKMELTRRGSCPASASHFRRISDRPPSRNARVS